MLPEYIRCATGPLYLGGGLTEEELANKQQGVDWLFHVRPASLARSLDALFFLKYFKFIVLDKAKSSI